MSLPLPRRALLARTLPLLSLIAADRIARADCASVPIWEHPIPITQVASDTKFGPGVSYFACGTALMAVYNETVGPHVGGSVQWTWSNPTGANINNFPSPCPLSFPPSPEAVFFSADDGWLYRVSTGGIGGTTQWSVNLKRSGFPADQVLATPTVQLYAYSNSTFRAAWGDDAVFVVTRYADPDQTSNRLVALRASTGVIQWQFNLPATLPVDYGTDACTVDYATNRLYFGTEEGFPGQPTLWAINSLSGGLLWSGPAGPITNRPQLLGGRLYVANRAGIVQAYDATGGAPLWAPAFNTGPVLRNVWPEFRGGNRYLTLVDQGGVLYRILDTGPVAVPAFPPTMSEGVPFATMPVFFPGSSSNKAYVGRNDGKVAEVDLTAGATTGTCVAGAAGALFDPALDYDTAAAPEPNRLMCPSSGGVTRWCIPFSTAAVAVAETRAPTSSLLAPPAPNPFRGSARIEFQVPKSGHVDLAVYDSRGALVKRLLSCELPAGSQATLWDGTDQAGRRVADGVYLYHLRAAASGAPAVEETRKIVLVN